MPRMMPWPTGVDAITMGTSDGGAWSWSCAKDCPGGMAKCTISLRGTRNFTELIGPLPSALATLHCKSRITKM